MRSPPRSRRATRPPGKLSSRRRAAGAATRSRRLGRPERLGRISTRRSPTPRSSSSGSRTAWDRCRRSRVSSTRSRSRTWPLTSSRPPRGKADSGSDTLSLARRGVRAAEGARLEIAYASKGVSRVQIPPSPLFLAVACLGIRGSGCQGAQVPEGDRFRGRTIPRPSTWMGAGYLAQPAEAARLASWAGSQRKAANARMANPIPAMMSAIETTMLKVETVSAKKPI